MRYEYAVKTVYTEGAVENSAALLSRKPLQIGLAERDLVSVKGKASVILDFGVEVSGGARILTYKAINAKTVRLRFGESVSETCAEIRSGDGEYGATNDHSNRDFTVDLQNYSDMTFGQTGFRFLRVDFPEGGEFLIKAIVAAVDTDEREEKGSFSCDDELVNEIWKTAARTMRLCLQNGYIWDGVKRDRLVWIGDLYPEEKAVHCLFGDAPEVLSSLDFSMEQSPLPGFINGMPTYSLWWVICLAEAYAVSGEKKDFYKYVDYVKGVIKEIITPCVGEDGTVSYSFDYIDWPSTYQEGESDREQKDKERHAGVAYLTKICLSRAKEFLTEFGESADLCDMLIARIDKKKYVVKIFKQIAALAVLSGEREEYLSEMMTAGGAKGLSTFQSYPILTAIASFGRYEEALSMMKDYYGGMLSVGATTFWEDFDMKWLEGAGRIDEMPRAGLKDIHGDYGKFCYKSFRHSLCHGWSTGITAYLIETVAGIRPENAGMTVISVKPNMSGLKRVSAVFPTKYGPVKVEHKLVGGKVVTKISAPEEIKIIG